MLTVRQLSTIGAAFIVGLLTVTVGAGLLWAKATIPQTAEIVGFSGNAGEWELTGTLTREGDTRELSGPIKLAHVGWCGVDGPEQKSGALKVRYHRLFAGIDATVSIDGVDCSYSGTLSDAYEGLMACQGRRPVQLLLWLR